MNVRDMDLRHRIQRARTTLRRLHENENGAEAGLERILLVAFIALPLLGLLVYYRDEVKKFISDSWKAATKGGTSVSP